MADGARPGTVGGMVEFLDKCARDPDFNTVTTMAMKSTVKSVSALLDIRRDEQVSGLDVESVMDRFQAAKGTAFRSAATYRTRFRVATQLYLAWLDGDPEWKSIARTRTSDRTGPPESAAKETMVVEFPVDGRLTIALELPRSLNSQTAQRLHALIDSFVVED
ncbi:hypothetical protein K1W54_26755 [Micromonospora sp. CPCC 205371]|nr:hypothetical protein [Micromonospora sp. CPCC 205371]